MIYCGAQAKGLKHPCCQSPNRVDDEESGKLRTCSTRTGHVRFLTRDSRRHFKTDVRKRQLNCFCFFLVLPGERRAASTEANMGVGGTHLESTLPPKQTHKAGQEAANLFDYFLGHLATFQFDHLHFWHTRGGEGAPFHMISAHSFCSVPFREILPR